MDADGVLVWSPHNLFLNSAAPASQDVPLLSFMTYTMSVVGTGSLTGSGNASGTATEGSPATFSANGLTGTFTKTGTLTQIQLNRGSVPTAYILTTGAPRFGLAVDHDPVTLAPRGLLCESQATNVVGRSNELTIGWTTSGFTVAQNASGPLGANTAFTLTATAGSSYKWTYIDRLGAAGNYYFSVYAKAGTVSWIALGDGGAAPSQSAYFNLATGTVGTASGRFSSPAMQAVGNGWYRCSALCTDAGSFISVSIHSADNQAYNWAAAGGETVFVSAVQVELTAVTSYIPTTNAAVTRATDQYNVVPASINYSATAGSWWAEVHQLGNPGEPRIIGYASVCAPLSFTGTTLYLYADTILSKNLGVAIVGNTLKVASAFQAGDRAVTGNGLTAATDADATTKLLAPGAFIHVGGVSATITHGYIRKAYYVPRRMSNAELQTETAP